MFRSFARVFVLVTLVGLISAQHTFAQGLTGAIEGTLRDNTDPRARAP